MLPIEVDRPFRLLGFATGGYMCRCWACKEQFTGDKRAITCLPCAVDQANAKAWAVLPLTGALETLLEGIGLGANLDTAAADARAILAELKAAQSNEVENG